MEDTQQPTHETQPASPQIPTPPGPTPTPMDNLPKTSTPPRHIPKLTIILIALILIALLTLGGIMMFKNMGTSKLSPTPTIVIQTSPTPTPDPTTDWLTYVASDNSYTLKYPSSFIWFTCPDGTLVFQPRIEGNKSLHSTTLETCAGDSYFDLEIRKEQAPDPTPITNESYQYISENITLAGLPAIKYTSTIAPTCYGYCAMWKERIEIENNGNFYYISLGNEELKEEFDQILSTLTFPK